VIGTALLLLSVSVCSALGACGGRVALDDDTSCAAPPPIVSLITCHGAVAVGDDGQQCSNLCLDQDEHEYLSVCNDDRCECWYDGEHLCDCDKATVESCRVQVICCPEPWQ